MVVFDLEVVDDEGIDVEEFDEEIGVGVCPFVGVVDVVKVVVVGAWVVGSLEVRGACLEVVGLGVVEGLAALGLVDEVAWVLVA